MVQHFQGHSLVQTICVTGCLVTNYILGWGGGGEEGGEEIVSEREDFYDSPV